MSHVEEGDMRPGPMHVLDRPPRIPRSASGGTPNPPRPPDSSSCDWQTLQEILYSARNYVHSTSTTPT